ncbi:MAG: hypothetical protein JKX74_06560, partial [Flavobacteriales bacterium]|nr:hypothetical protein [Flavobacteriales bacterium]
MNNLFMGSICKRFKIALALLTLLVSGFVSFAQSPDTPWDRNLFDDKEAYKVAYKHLQKGESLYKQGIYSKALTHYLPAHKFNPNNSDLNLKIGQCYLYSSSKPSAKTYLVKALELNERINISIHLLLGKSYHLEMEWFRAIEQYGKFINLASQEDI